MFIFKCSADEDYFQKKHNDFRLLDFNPGLLGATMRTIFSCIYWVLFHATLCNLNGAWDTRQKQITKKNKSVTQLSKQSVDNSQVGRVCVSIVMQSNMAAESAVRWTQGGM